MLRDERVGSDLEREGSHSFSEIGKMSLIRLGWVTPCAKFELILIFAPGGNPP